MGFGQVWLCPLRGRRAEWDDRKSHSSGWAGAPGGPRTWRLGMVRPQRIVCDVCARTSLWVGPRRRGGEVPPGSLQLLRRALLCGVDL